MTKCLGALAFVSCLVFTATESLAGVGSAFAVDCTDVGVFCVTKDVGIRGHETEQMSQAGAAGQIRPLRGGGQSTALLDFDSVAMQAYLDANPGTATWTLHMFPNTVTFSNDMEIRTIESVNDWAEGDGNGSVGGQINFNWTEGTPAATYFYAQTYYSTIGGVKTLDTANSLPWEDSNGNRYTMTKRVANNAAYGVPTAGAGAIPDANFATPIVNSQDVLSSDYDSAGFNGTDVTVDLDPALINDILNNVNNRGIRFADPAGVSPGDFGGGRISDQNASATNQGPMSPYLTVSITAGVAGDYNGDGAVDAEDYTVWRDGNSPDSTVAGYNLWVANYGTGTSSSESNAVPEPASLLIVAFGSLALLATRSKRA